MKQLSIAEMMMSVAQSTTLRKAGPLKNRPGLQLDPSAHRWKRQLAKMREGLSDKQHPREHEFGASVAARTGAHYLGHEPFEVQAGHAYKDWAGHTKRPTYKTVVHRLHAADPQQAARKMRDRLPLGTSSYLGATAMRISNLSKRHSVDWTPDKVVRLTAHQDHDYDPEDENPKGHSGLTTHHFEIAPSPKRGQ